MKSDSSSQSTISFGPHPKFGPLLFDQKYRVVPGIAALVFGIVLILVGVGCFAKRDDDPRFLIASICGMGIGAIVTAVGIHFLLVKTGITYHFYQSGLVYRSRSSVIETAYSDLAGFSVKTSRSGGQMPGNYFNMRFITRDGRKIKYQLGVDEGDVHRMDRAKKLIEHIQASIPSDASK